MIIRSRYKEKIIAYIIDFNRECDQISFVFDEIREKTDDRLTLHADVSSTLLITWQQDGRPDDDTRSVVGEMMDAFIDTDSQPSCISNHFRLPDVSVLVLEQHKVT